MPSISPFITYETLHCVHRQKRKDESTSNPQNNGFNYGAPKKNAGFARVIKQKKTVPEPKKIAFSTRWAFLVLVFSFSVRKIPFAGIELTSQRVRGYMVPLSYRGDQYIAMQGHQKNSEDKTVVVCDVIKQ